MTYIVKHLNNGNCGVYDTIRGCFPIAGPELREAGVSKIVGDDNGWFKKANVAKAETIVATLNAHYGYAEGTEAKVSKPKVKASADADEAAFQKAGKALIDAEKKARA